MEYINEFLIFALVNAIAVISPGPDFFIVLKQTISNGRIYAYFCCLGIGAGIIFHLSYTLLGIQLLLELPYFFTVIQILGAIYLLYIGILSLLSNSSKIKIKNINEKKIKISYKKSFMIGLLCNVLNPKATLFFISIFSTLISASTPIYVKSIYGVYCLISNVAWFMFVVSVLSKKKNLDWFSKHRKIIDKVLGIILITFGFNIFLSIDFS